MSQRSKQFKHRFNTVERYILKSTSPKIKPIKPKHLQVLTNLTWQNDVSIDVFFELIMPRVREGNWVGVFKSLILVHFLINQGHTDKVLAYLLSSPVILVNCINYRNHNNTDFQANIQSKNVRAYALYLNQKVLLRRVNVIQVTTYPKINDDFVRSKAEFIAKFRTLEYSTKNVGLLDHVEALQKQIEALLNCSFYLDEIDNIVTLQSFRLLIIDAMALFHLLNEGVIRILSLYFEMERSYAARSLDVYKNFAKETAKIVEMFDIARKLRGSLGVEVPIFKHAPLSLAGALEEYLNAPDFDAQRLAYKMKKAHKSKVTASTGSSTPQRPISPAPRQKADQNIDFFSSLDDAVNSHYSPTTQAIYNNVSYNPGDPFGNQQDPFANDDSIANKQQPLRLQSYNPQTTGQNQNAFTQQPQISTNANPFQYQQQQQPLSEFTIDNVFGSNSNAVFAPHNVQRHYTGPLVSNAPNQQPGQNFIGGSLDPFALTSGTQQKISPFHNQPSYPTEAPPEGGYGSPNLNANSFSANQKGNYTATSTNSHHQQHLPSPLSAPYQQLQGTASGQNFSNQQPVQPYGVSLQNTQTQQIPNLSTQFSNLSTGVGAYTSFPTSFQSSQIPFREFPRTSSPIPTSPHQQPFGVTSQPQHTAPRPTLPLSRSGDAFAGLNPFGMPPSVPKPTDGMTLEQIARFNQQEMLAMQQQGTNNPFGGGDVYGKMQHQQSSQPQHYQSGNGR